MNDLYELTDEIIMMNDFYRDSRAKEIASSSSNTDAMDHEKQIQVQNDEYFKVYDYITKNVPKEDQIEILDLNKQMVPDTDAEVNEKLQLFN